MAAYNDGSPVAGPLTHTPPLFHKRKLLTIVDVYKFQLGKLVYESVNGKGPANKVIKFASASESHHHDFVSYFTFNKNCSEPCHLTSRCFNIRGPLS